MERIPHTATPAIHASRLYRLSDLLDAFNQAAQRLEHARNTQIPPGPVTGLDSLDRELCGYLHPGLHVLTGNTGAGKSAFAWWIAARCGTPALYVSCELSALELLRRHIAATTQTYLSRLKNWNHSNPLSAAEMSELARRAIAQTPSLVLVDATQAWAPPEYLEEQVHLLRQDYEADGVLLVVDSLHSWARAIEGDEYGRLELAIDRLQDVAAATGAAVLLISEQTKQANRQAESTAMNGAGHRVIGYGAESVWTLTAEESAADEIPVTLRLVKNRHGRPGASVRLKFQAGFMRFEEA